MAVMAAPIVTIVANELKAIDDRITWHKRIHVMKNAETISNQNPEVTDEP